MEIVRENIEVDRLDVRVLLCVWEGIGAQETKPTVVSATNHDQNVSPAANRTVALRLDNVPLSEALQVLADSAHLTLTFSRSQLPAEKWSH